MDESNDKCNWKKVFKKFLEPQNPAKNENIQRNNMEYTAPVWSFEDQEKCVSESSLISCSPASNDSGYGGCKFEFHGKLQPETHTFEPNLNFPQSYDYKPECNNDSLKNPPPNYELNMNIPKTNIYKTELYDKLSSKKLPPHQFKTNSPQASGCKLEFHQNIPSKMLYHDQNLDIPHTRGDSDDKKIDSKVPEWNKAFKSILKNNASVVNVPHQKDIYPSKETENFENSHTSGITSQRKQSSYKPKRRYEKYKDYEVNEAEKRVKEIFDLSRKFKIEQVNINDFHGCGVDIFKQDQSTLTKSTYGTSKLTDKPYLPLTGFIAKSKPYTAADVAASYVPFDEDAWDDDLLI